MDSWPSHSTVPMVPWRRRATALGLALGGMALWVAAGPRVGCHIELRDTGWLVAAGGALFLSAPVVDLATWWRRPSARTMKPGWVFLGILLAGGAVWGVALASYMMQFPWAIASWLAAPAHAWLVGGLVRLAVRMRRDPLVGPPAALGALTAAAGYLWLVWLMMVGEDHFCYPD